MRIHVALLAAMFFVGCEAQPTQTPKAVSEFGKYEGYSEPIYEEWVRSSVYVPMPDGVKLAVDIVRPAVNGELVEEPLPAVWTHHRYHRAREQEGRVLSIVDRSPPLQTLIRHGYIVVAADSRGSGASYGREVSQYSQEHTRDAYELTEWLASQSWCDGNVGMFGSSYMGITQFMAASLAPPHLKAIFPAMATFDLYNLPLPGGVYLEPILKDYLQGVRQGDLETPAPPVDEDSSGSMLREAMVQHQDNIYPEWDKGRYRDSQEGFDWARNNPVAYVKQINASQIPVYIWEGWYDLYARDGFQWYVNLDNPKKLTIGLWGHSVRVLNPDEHQALTAIEQLRWFDYWLKGIENGIMDEPSVHYATKEDDEEWVWNTADDWPSPVAEEVRFYFSDGPSGSVDSVNDGSLTEGAPRSDVGEDAYVTDYSTTSGLGSRWRRTETTYPNLAENDAKGLTYTTDPLDEDLTVTGHPVVTLFITSTAQDGDFYVYLEEVDGNGISRYVTDGVLRASLRAVSEPPFENMGLPYHRSYEEDIKTLPEGEPVALTFDLQPTSNVFNQGHRIRVTMTCADADNAEMRVLTPAPEVTLYRNRQHASGIVLPVVAQ